MIEIQLKQVPNQKLSINIDSVVFNITIKSTDSGSTIMSLNIDGTDVLSGVRCMPNRLIIPYQYLENGNLFFACLDDAYPNYANFGTTQKLIYLTTAELETLRG